MKLNHLNLVVVDVPAAHAFLETYFGLQSMEGGNNNMRGLVDSNGFTLVLMGIGSGSDSPYPDGFHIGFIQDSEEQVRVIHQRLTSDGFDVPGLSLMHLRNHRERRIT
jgi:lactoylglutathione lyase